MRVPYCSGSFISNKYQTDECLSFMERGLLLFGTGFRILMGLANNSWERQASLPQIDFLDMFRAMEVFKETFGC